MSRWKEGLPRFGEGRAGKPMSARTLGSPPEGSAGSGDALACEVREGKP